ncbi:hypothetical protein like AT5G61820 [Hibiscus trionum]|uniref:Stress up-regulated Nod 19 protein n=1 Tax=Hibiscus trionum TaxID=183268 RepID=A0A9W7HGX8_HIBTR|nr:hypothetical protein like AT5G61820 [Hibiscus trionum]
MGSCNIPLWLPLVLILVTINSPCTQAVWRNANKMKTADFLTPKIVLGPGSVANRFFYNVDFPKGHIALKDFNAELVDEQGNPVPLYETYLHHWSVIKYNARIGAGEISELVDNLSLNSSDYISRRNDGICQDGVHGHFFGAGSETRKTETRLPDLYGIELGNPADLPSGFEEKWLINVHAIDTRGVVDKLGCTECRCDLYNVTKDKFGRPLSADYNGGLLCCYEGTQCRLKQGFQGIKRNVYLKYTVKWVDMDTSILPVRIYVFDITDQWKRTSNSTGINSEHDCKVEYEIEPCNATGWAHEGCIDTKRVSLDMTFSGYMLSGFGHQHAGGTGSALYREDGRVMCSLKPIYGQGQEVGNEAGYIVGISSCYLEPGTMKISKGETLVLESNYSSIRRHTGVMGLFSIFVADELPKPMSAVDIVAQVSF